MTGAVRQSTLHIRQIRLEIDKVMTIVDMEKFRKFLAFFSEFIDDLSVTWPAKDIEFLRKELGYGEYPDALENLIAIGLKNGIGFTAAQREKVKYLASETRLDPDPWLEKMRQTPI